MPGTQGRSGRRTVGSDYMPLDGGPVRPTHLSDAAKTHWTHILDQLDPKLLRRVDQHLLGQLCELLAQAEAIPAKIAGCDDDRTEMQWTRLLVSINAQVGRMSVLFGLSPRDRASLEVVAETPEEDAALEWALND